MQKKVFKKQNNTQPEKTGTFPMRINKYLALKNYSTRRGADELIKEKKVFINGQIALLGDQVGKDDNVEVRYRGKPQPKLYFAYNKPRGIITHSAQGEEKEIADVFPIKGVFPIGRLDKDSHGLIILTNDGRLTDRLLSPAYEHEKEYLVRTKNNLRSSFEKNMEKGVRIENDMTKPCQVEILGPRKFRVILTEGKKHQIRRMCVALFQEVEDLERIRVMNIKLGSLKPGQYRKIEGRELEFFLSTLNLLTSI